MGINQHAMFLSLFAFVLTGLTLQAPADLLPQVQ